MSQEPFQNCTVFLKKSFISQMFLFISNFIFAMGANRAVGRCRSHTSTNRSYKMGTRHVGKVQNTETAFKASSQHPVEAECVAYTKQGVFNVDLYPFFSIS